MTTPSRPPRRAAILIVDADDAFRVSLASTLAERYEVTAVRSVAGALTVLQSRDIALVVLDIRLPHVSGLELLRWLGGEGHAVPVIVISTLSSVDVVVAALKAGAADYFTKPVDASRVVTTIEAILRRGAGGRRPGPLAATEPSGGDLLLVGRNLGLLAAMRVLTAAAWPSTIASTARSTLQQLAKHTAAVLVYEDAFSAAERTIIFRSLAAATPPPHRILLADDASSLWRDRDARQLFRVALPRDCRATELHAAVLACRPPPALRPIGLPGRLSAPVEKAIDYLARHHAERLSVLSVASETGMSMSRLEHLFRGEVGLTLRDFSTELKVEITRHLLTDSDEKIEAIAAAAGFSDASHLSRTFRQRLGVSPGRFRRRETRAS